MASEKKEAAQQASENDLRMETLLFIAARPSSVNESSDGVQQRRPAKKQIDIAYHYLAIIYRATVSIG